MKRLLYLAFLIPLLSVAAATPLLGQDGSSPSAPLESFVLHVARLWATGNAAALAELAPSDGKILLDVGEGAGSVSGRHASAALRTVFGDRETVSIRPARTAVAGGRPQRAFSELSWTFRSRGVSTVQSSSVFVGAVWEDQGWRIRELRILR